MNMKLNTVVPTSLSTSTSQIVIEKRTSLLDRWRAERAASREAGHSLAELKTARIQAETRIATTSLKIAEVQIKTALLSSSMTQIGALTLNLNEKTAAVEQRLTSASQGELIAHLQNRGASLAVIKSLELEGRISEEEGKALASFAQTDAVEDINRSRERTRKAKEAVEALHAFALDGIAHASDDVSR